MPLSVDELLKPRYKVIADWPGRQFFLTAILNINEPIPDGRIRIWIEHNKQKEWYLWNNNRNGNIDDYPHLLKKLEWYEDRKPEEMPEYVKGFGKVYDLKKVAERNETGFVIDHPMTEEPVPFNRCLPATREDYELYQSTVK